MSDINPIPTHEAGDALGAMLGDDLLVDTGGADDAPGDEASDEPRGDAALASEATEDAPAAPPEADDEDEPAGGAPDDEDEPGDDEAEEPGEEPASTGEMFTVRIDGQDHQVSKDEVLKGYSRTADYTRKSMALAEERKALGTERGQYGQLLGALHQRVSELMPQEPNWQALQADPQQYVAAQEMWRQKQAAEAELSRLDAEDNARDQIYREQQIAEGQKWLLSVRPEWNDPAVRQQDFVEVLEYAKQIGYSDEELAEASDPRALLAVWKAAQYDKLQANAADVRRNAKPKRVTLRAGSATSMTDGQNRRSTQSAMAKLRKGGGKFEDAAGMLGSMLGDDLS